MTVTVNGILPKVSVVECQLMTSVDQQNVFCSDLMASILSLPCYAVLGELEDGVAGAMLEDGVAGAVLGGRGGWSD